MSSKPSNSHMEDEKQPAIDNTNRPKLVSTPISSNIDGFATHLSPLVISAMKTGELFPESPILELGCGHYSTPLLSNIAKNQNREFHLLCSDTSWMQFFVRDCKNMHRVDHRNWKHVTYDSDWGLVLVDHEEHIIDRFQHLYKLSEKAKVVVFHDANRINESGISWWPIQTLYRYVYFYDRYCPTTAILSNYVDPSDWFN